jgi:hypothetical protein
LESMSTTLTTLRSFCDVTTMQLPFLSKTYFYRTCKRIIMQVVITQEVVT